MTRDKHSGLTEALRRNGYHQRPDGSWYAIGTPDLLEEIDRRLAVFDDEEVEDEENVSLAEIEFLLSKYE